MATTTTKYTVKSGDSLWSIATRYNTTVSAIHNLNKSMIKDVSHIEVGWVLTIPIQSSSGSSSSTTTVTQSKCQIIIKHFGVQAQTDRTVFAMWDWDKANTDKFKKSWDYYVGGYWFKGTEVEENDKESIYNAPSNATHVRFRVIPISKTYTKNKKEVKYWTAEWSDYEVYTFADNPPTQPSPPNVEIKNLQLTATWDGLDVNASTLEYEVIKNNVTHATTGSVNIVTGHASFTCPVVAGNEYKVRCRAVRDGLYSQWSEYSENRGTPPAASSGITICRGESDTSIYLEWNAVSNAETYEVEYSTKKEYFDGSTETTPQTNILYPHFLFTGLESGKEYFFRVRAINDGGESPWSELASVVIGKAPIAPTTWSSTTTCVVGENLTLYWLHNAEDNSTQTYAEVELYINGKKETYTVRTDEEPDDEKTMHFPVDTNEFVEGSKIQWRVRTAGVTKTYGDWSIQRTVDIYSPAALEIQVTDVNGNNLETLSAFPFYLAGTTGPDTQTPISYHVSIVSNDFYEDIDDLGNDVIINPGDEVYSKNFDTDEQLVVEFTAGNVDLRNSVNYTINVTVAMNSGLTATASKPFKVSWLELGYVPNAEIGIDPERLVAYIRPYVVDDNDIYVEGVTLSVYRREFDGTFTEISTGIDNTKNTTVTDPHPALDYARYRIVAKTESTGTIEYYDVPGYPVGESAIIIQWEETYSSFDTTNEDALEDPTWAGTFLRLPYNINVSDDNSPDVSLVKYIGRKHPVSYYGTQLGMTSTWDAVIPKTDEKTLYALRRLQIWQGNVYVREPSGSGYWANLTVSFSQKYDDLTIPISLKITRVEGGA